MNGRGLGAALAALLALAATGAAGADGAALFESHCAACHNSGGTGNPGLAPPLDRPEFWQSLGDQADDYIGGVVTHGLNGRIRVRGEDYVGMVMPPVPGASDAELAEIANWVLATLGQTGAGLDAARIAAIRTGGPGIPEIKAMRPRTE